jgi:hypothetical protein
VSTSPDALPFIRNLTQSKDVCDHYELQDSEGFFFTPETRHLTHSLVPIWSQSKPSSFNYILFPSPYYTTRRGDYVEGEDRLEPESQPAILGGCRDWKPHNQSELGPYATATVRSDDEKLVDRANSTAQRGHTGQLGAVRN